VPEQETQRLDPLSEVISLIATPIANGIRSVEQFKRGIDELFRTIENVNQTMATLNAAALRVDRLMADVEEPIRTILPQVSRTVKTADELLDVVGSPARLVAPNLVQIADTLGSPAFTSLPQQLNEFLRVMGEMSHRLGPLMQFAESAGGMFGLRLGGHRQPVDSGPPAATPRPAEPEHAPARRAPAKQSAAKKAAAKGSAAARKSATKKSATKKSAAKQPASRTSTTSAARPRAARRTR
jgi:hypothetical protein